MTKALFWKEWRTIQNMTFAIVVAFMIMRFVTIEKYYVDHVVMGVWVIYLLFLGVTSFSTEQSKNNLLFLLSLTARRSTIWLVKLSLRLVIIVIFLLYISAEQYFEVAPKLLIVVSLSLFAFCFFISLQIESPITCASAAFVFEVSLLIILFKLSWTIVWSVLFLLLISMISIAVSYKKFRNFV
ncbi:hypothetical protein [Candidatus Uabimicrobium sp. HlEnr_7]|uniref:hypothetical protein n=1 Tax=Candidatus Uabimicrobium helgolandensis TaxID=3095367 RepID=UPI00355647B6